MLWVIPFEPTWLICWLNMFTWIRWHCVHSRVSWNIMSSSFNVCIKMSAANVGHSTWSSRFVMFSSVCWLYVSEALGVNLRTFSFMYWNISSFFPFFWFTQASGETRGIQFTDNLSSGLVTHYKCSGSALIMWSTTQWGGASGRFRFHLFDCHILRSSFCIDIVSSCRPD